MAANSLGLAPVAVIPGRQRQGIGKALVSEGIERCRSIGGSVIAVLSDPANYTQFGFTRAMDFGLGNEYQVGDEFMVIELSPVVLDNFTGMVCMPQNSRKLASEISTNFNASTIETILL